MYVSYSNRFHRPARKYIISLPLMVAMFATYSLVSGAAYLESLLPGELPFGNALTAIGLCSAAGAAIGLSQPGTILRAVSAASFVAAVLWLPLSIALAGNLALVFNGGRGVAWVWINIGTVSAVSFSLALALCSLLVSRVRRAIRSRAA